MFHVVFPCQLRKKALIIEYEKRMSTSSNLTKRANDDDNNDNVSNQPVVKVTSFNNFSSQESQTFLKCSSKWNLFWTPKKGKNDKKKVKAMCV